MPGIAKGAVTDAFFEPLPGEDTGRTFSCGGFLMIGRHPPRAVEDADNAVLISAASACEITTKFRLGKLPEAAAVAKNVPVWIEKAGFRPLAGSPAHAQLAGAWEQTRRDPFDDQMLAAQAKLEKVVLATVDDALAAFPIQIMSR